MSQVLVRSKKTCLMALASLGFSVGANASGALPWVYQTEGHPQDVVTEGVTTLSSPLLSRFVWMALSNDFLRFSSRKPSGVYLIVR